MTTMDDSLFWDRIAAKYAAKPVRDEAAYQTKLELTRRYLSPTSNVLEFACGTGTTALKHAPLVTHIDAIDFSKAMIGIAREKADHVGAENASFHVAAIEDWGRPDGTYDVIMAHSILHLLRDPGIVIDEVFRLLRPGGVFVSNTACISDILPFFKVIAPVGRFFGLLPYLSIFSADHLRAHLTDAGFVIVEEFRAKKRDALFLIARKPE